MGEGEFTETTLRVFIQDACLDSGMREPVQEQMGLRQVGRGTQAQHVTPPGRRIPPRNMVANGGRCVRRKRH